MPLYDSAESRGAICRRSPVRQPPPQQNAPTAFSESWRGIPRMLPSNPGYVGEREEHWVPIRTQSGPNGVPGALWAAEERGGRPTPHSITSSARGEQRRWHFDVERPGGLEIDDQLDFRDLLNRQVRGFLAFENSPYIEADGLVHLCITASIAHQTARRSEFGELVDRGQRVTKRLVRRVVRYGSSGMHRLR